MTIAIDFDNTWTLDPAGWLAFYELFTTRGHKVIMATGRTHWSDDMARARLPASMPIIYCGREMKERAVLKAGYKVDVWIDDMPGMIQECLILGEVRDDTL